MQTCLSVYLAKKLELNYCFKSINVWYICTCWILETTKRTRALRKLLLPPSFHQGSTFSASSKVRFNLPLPFLLLHLLIVLPMQQEKHTPINQTRRSFTNTKIHENINLISSLFCTQLCSLGYLPRSLKLAATARVICSF